MKECIVVLGMHRSGTSVLTGLLNIIGNYAGADMVIAKPDNPKGFFENKKVLELNEKILTENGSSWSGNFFSAELITPKKLDEYVHLAKKAIIDQFNYASKIIIKDPRICLLFPIWEKALISLSFEIKIIIAYRNPIEVALSLKQRNEFPIELGLLLWSQHFFESEQASRSYERIFVEFNSDFLDLDKLLIKISKFSGIPLTDSNKKLAKEFYTPSLKHQNLSLKNTSSNLPHYLTSIIKLLVSRNFDNSEEIDQLRNEFFLSQEFFLYDKKNIEYQIKTQQNKIDEQHSEISSHQETIKTLNTEICIQEKNIDDKQEEINQHKIRNDKDASKYQQIENKLIEKESQIHSEKDKLTTAYSTFHEILETKTTLTQLQKSIDNRALLKLKMRRPLSFFSTSKTKCLQKDKELILQSGLFSPAYYLFTYEDVRKSKMDPLTHYCAYGWKENRQPAPDFDVVTYINENQNVKNGKINPLIHFIKNSSIYTNHRTVKENKPRLIKLLNMWRLIQDYFLPDKDHLTNYIDASWYKEQYKLSTQNISPLHHFKKHIDSANPNLFFCNNYYTIMNEDINASSLQPIIHYIRYGEKEGRKPHPLFDPNYYVAQSSHLRSNNRSALHHFLHEPHEHLLDPSPYFSTKWYLDNYPDVREAKIHPLKHFIEHGWREDRDPSPLFSVKYYKETTKTDTNSEENPLIHFVQEGEKKGHWPNPFFDPSYYQSTFMDANLGEVKPLQHFLEIGIHNGYLGTEELESEIIQMEWKKTLNAIKKEGTNIYDGYIKYCSRVIHSNSPYSSVLQQKSTQSDYQKYLRFSNVTTPRKSILKKQLESCKHKPLITLICPTYNTPINLLDELVTSINEQIYDKWEICFCDDNSPNELVRNRLKYWADQDIRIKWTHNENNGGIAKATNIAATLATGEYIALVDHDDLLTCDALAEVVIAINKNPNVDVLYSDDDKIDIHGNRYDPQFKPDWSPTLLLSFMYFSHLFVFKASLYKELGGLKSEFDGSQDYDFALRLTEKAQSIVHIPRVLYHWRAVEGSTALSANEKSDSIIRGQNAVDEAFKRRQQHATIHQPEFASNNHLGIFEPKFSDDGPQVTLLIPTKNRHDLVKNLFRSLKQTTYKNYNILLIDNDSDDPKTIKYFKSLTCDIKKISSPKGKFNYAHLMNRAVEHVKSEYVLFLNNDTEIVNSNWLSQMMGHAEMHDQIGAVGARILFPHGNTVQHAGITHGFYNGLAGPLFRNITSWDTGYLNLAKVSREVLAVTAACMLTPVKTFWAMGGFDEKNFGVAYNDVDYCYRLTNNNKKVIYCATAELLHDEGSSRGHVDNPQELANFRTKYLTQADPYFNPAISKKSEKLTIRPRVVPHSNKRVTLAAVSHNLNFEGAPQSMFEMIKGLTEATKIKATVFSPEDGPLRTEYESNGITVKVIKNPMIGVHDKDQLVNNLGVFARELVNNKFEVVYANTLQTHWAITSARQANLPAIWNVRESEPWQSYFDYVPKKVRKYSYESFMHIYRMVFVANATANGWSALDANNTFEVIPNGLRPERLREKSKGITRNDARKALQLENNAVMFLLLGTVCDRKGQMDLVQAIKELDTTCPANSFFYIVGDRDSDYSKELHKLHEELPSELKNKLTIVPETGKTGVYYQAADVKIVASRIESYPRVILEALAHQLPIISTPVFGIPEQITDGVNGLFYQPGDIKKLAMCILSLTNDNEKRQTFKENADATLQTLTSYEDMVRRYGQIFFEARESSPGLKPIS